MPSALRNEMPSVATTSTGGAGRRRWCRRGSGLRQAHVGQQVAVAGRLGGEARARSAPTIRPVTPVLPPKNSLATGITRTSSRPSAATSGVEHPRRRTRRSGCRRGAVRSAAGLPRCAPAPRTCPTPGCAAPGSPPPGRRRPRRRSRPATPVGACDVAGELELERARHADAVLVHREALVALRRRERPSGQEVVLVGGEARGGGRATRGKSSATPRRVDDGGRLGRGCGAHAGSVLKRAHAERHDARATPARGTRRARRPACRRARRRR